MRAQKSEGFENVEVRNDEKPRDVVSSACGHLMSGVEDSRGGRWTTGCVISVQ